MREITCGAYVFQKVFGRIELNSCAFFHIKINSKIVLRYILFIYKKITV